MTLQTYQTKRDFEKTREPKGEVQDTGRQRFVVQEHHASSLHFDFRLEMGGVLVSWAVPKGPSLDPATRHLAMRVEDHPVDYIDFEGEIAPGNYGAGQVAIWDHGTYETLEEGDPLEQVAAGKIAFRLHGQKLKGDFALVQMRSRGGKQWLLIKSKDEYAQPGWELKLVLPGNGARPAGRSARRGTTKMPAAKKTGTKRAGTKKAAPRKSASAKKSAKKSPAKKSRAARSSDAQPGRSAPGSALAAPLAGAEAAPMPAEIEPMLATLVDAPPPEEWFFETKWDGVRAVCYLEGGRARLMSRNRKELGLRYPELDGLPSWVAARSAILDGEIVVLEDGGRSNFQRLQARIGLQDPAEIKRLAAENPVTYVVFDLLYYDGFDLRLCALADRKAQLRQVLTPRPVLAFSEHSVGQGDQAFQAAQAAGQEGIVAKRPDSHYLGGRGGAWLKIKALQRQEVVIGGYTQPRRTRQFLGALVVGLYDGGQLRYAGHVGGGFDRQSLEQVFELLQPLKVSRSPFAEEPPTNEPVQWVQPQRVAEVKFAGWTNDRKMRQPIFLGLRDDKDPRQITLELPQPVEAKMKTAARPARAGSNGKTKAKSNGATRRTTTRTAGAVPASSAFAKQAWSGDLELRLGSEQVALTHLDRVYWPAEQITKFELVRYYWRVGATLLPHLKDRPLILKRYPNGVDAPPFFQHDVAVETLPAFVKTYTSESEEGRSIDYVLCQNRATLLYLANLGTIAMNAWNSRVGSIDRPDWMVFDLDPGQVDFGVVCQAALAIKDALDQLGLKSLAKTSGSRGIHVVVPLKSVHPYEQVAELAERIARQVADERADIATVERSKRSRPSDKVYVDFLQNARGKSVASAYSVREHPGATVSAPLDWREVKACRDMAAFNINTMPARLKRRGDLFKGVLNSKQELKGMLEKLR